jgi:hypothetical protein
MRQPTAAPRGAPVENPGRLTDDDASVWHLVLLRRPRLMLFTASRDADRRDGALMMFARVHLHLRFSMHGSQQVAIRGERRASVAYLASRRRVTL